MTKISLCTTLKKKPLYGKGWADTAAAFASYKGPRKRTSDDDPSKWVAEWSVPGLSEDLRRKLKAQLIRADGVFWKTPDAPSADIAAMRQAFTGIAKVLSEAGILTEAALHDHIPLLVWDSAIAGGWYRFASTAPDDIFPEQLRHYSVWRDGAVDWPSLLYSETSPIVRADCADSCRAPPRRAEGKHAMPRTRGSTGV